MVNHSTLHSAIAGFRALMGTLVAGSLALAQSAPPTVPRNPQAITLVAQASSALAKVALTDVTIQAAVHSIQGSDDETVQGKFEAGGPDTSKVVLSYSTGALTEVRNGTTGFWLGADSTQHAIPLHNALNMQAWFFPAFVVQGLAQNTNYSLAAPAVATTTEPGASATTAELVAPSASTTELVAATAQSVPGYRLPSGTLDDATETLLASATAFELAIDPSTFLPASLDFQAHPDNDAIAGFPVHIEYSDYRLVQGVQVPFHVQKFLQGTLTLDITVTSCQLNTGIPASEFLVP
jgi:hypothetical protein